MATVNEAGGNQGGAHGRVKTAVLISGRGSNMQALLEAARAPAYPAEIALVVANTPAAAGLGHAAAAGVPTAVVEQADFASRAGFEAALDATLASAGIDLVCLAGFMRVLTADFVDRWRDRLINIHPSLLPAFPGAHAVTEALAAGVKITGTTVHFVREAVDDGPVIGQAAVPVLNGDGEAALGARIRAVEHRLYPRCLAAVAAGRVSVVGKWVDLGTPGVESDPDLPALIHPQR